MAFSLNGCIMGILVFLLVMLVGGGKRNAVNLYTQFNGDVDNCTYRQDCD